MFRIDRLRMMIRKPFHIAILVSLSIITTFIISSSDYFFINYFYFRHYCNALDVVAVEMHCQHAFSALVKATLEAIFVVYFHYLIWLVMIFIIISNVCRFKAIDLGIEYTGYIATSYLSFNFISISSGLY